jgi:hypothetical protein
MVPVALRAPSTMPAPQPCSVLIPCFEVTNSETAGVTKLLKAKVRSFVAQMIVISGLVK